MKNHYLWLVLFLFGFGSVSNAQLISKIDLNHRASQASGVVEGRVVSQFSFWDNPRHNIYTASKIEVYKVMKGSPMLSYVEIITPGGTVGLEKQVVTPSLGLKVGDVGVFFTKTPTVQISATRFTTPVQYEAYSGPQGFIVYEEKTGHAHDPFTQYTHVDRDIFNVVERIVNYPAHQVRDYDLNQAASSGTLNRGIGITISDFSPTTVTAGTGTAITINGFGFGTEVGVVGFSNANDGGATHFAEAFESQILSWTDTQIIVEVPSEAGTGTIFIENDNGESIISSGTLTVDWSRINVVSFDNGTDNAYIPQHVDANFSGGYTWQMFTDFDASPANAAFTRAFETWVCETGINWVIGSTTNVDHAANDLTNVIRHDNGGELPIGVLGRNTSRYNACQSGPDLFWYVTEFDIVFDDSQNWNYSTNAPDMTEYDFETVALHELGHALQIGHVIDPTDPMHFALSNGSQFRTPNANNIASANAIMIKNTTTSVCNFNSMTAIDCGPPVPLTRLRDGYCSDTLAALNTYLKCYPVSGADAYEFRIVNNSMGVDETLMNLWYNPLLSSIVHMPFDKIHYGTTYTVTVRARVNEKWGNFGPPCDVTTPCNDQDPFCIPVPRISTGSCGDTLVFNKPFPAQKIPGAEAYRFRLVNTDQGYDDTVTQRYLPPHSRRPWVMSFNLADNGNIQPNTTYCVTVSVEVGGNWSNFGDTCYITTDPNYAPRAFQSMNGSFDAVTEWNDGIFQSDGGKTSMVVYPNPGKGSETLLSIENLSKQYNTVDVMVLDAYGKQVYNKNANVSGDHFNTLIRFNQRLAPGIYFIHVNAGETRMSRKLIVQ